MYFKWHSSCRMTYLIAISLYTINLWLIVMFLLLEQLPHAYFMSFILILFGISPVIFISSCAFVSIICLNCSCVYNGFFSCFFFSFSKLFSIHSDFCSIIFSSSFLDILFGAFIRTFTSFIWIYTFFIFEYII